MRLKMQVLIAALIVCMLITLPDGKAANSDYDQLREFTQVKVLIDRYYVRDVSEQDLMEGALKGMLQNLDPHSSYLNVKEFAEMRENTAGEFFGVGIEISVENGQVIVVSPIEDTPAYRAGVKAGDIILAIDGQPTQDLSSQEVVGKIRGPKGSKVELLLLHKDSRVPTTVSIERDAIPMNSVKARFIDEGYLWVRLTRFSERSTQELRKAVADARAGAEIKGIILDMRNNPGGLLDQAVSISDLFLQDGMIVSMRGRGAKQDKEFKASRSKGDMMEPVVVLVNSGTASAAEIVAGALQDRKRAVLIGERTFGKGSVQQIIPVGSNGSAVKLTTALYYTPSGRSIQAEGIEPDLNIPFEQPREGVGTMPRISLREQDLSGHLEVDRDKKNAAKQASKVDPNAQEFLAADNQLRVGLEMVKSLPILQSLSWNAQ